MIRPENPASDADRDAVRQIDALANRAFLGPMLEGAYPADLLHDTRSVSDWSFVREGDLAQIAVPLDLLGVNYYSTILVRRWRGDGKRLRADGHGQAAASAWIAADNVEFLPQPGPYTTMGWNIEPAGLTELLVSLHERYPKLPLMVTENGAAFDDVAERRRPGARPAAHRLPARPHRGRSAPRSMRGSTFAATSSGACSTTSNGRSASTAGSASCGSTR